MRYVRIFAEATPDNPEAPPFCVDAILDDADEIVGSAPLFGVQGRFNRRDEHFEPFVLDSDGRVDWGDGFDQAANDRFGHFDIRSDCVTLGRLLTLRTGNYGVQLYRITRITPLP